MGSESWEKRTIKAFVEYLSSNSHPGLSVNSWPDENERGEEEIDAVAGNFAIEHTSIDTLPDQREKNAQFMKSIGCLQSELKGQVPFYLRLIVKWDAIEKGQKYGETKEAIKRWILEETPKLPFGQHCIEAIDDVPFALDVRKDERLTPGLYVGRFEIPDDTLPNRMKILIDRKARKLSKDRWAKHTRILIIESDDLALMNKIKMLEALQNAYPSSITEGLDEIWYADTAGFGHNCPAQFIKMTKNRQVVPVYDIP